MTQEQKAKAYDKLFIKAKRIYNKENDVLIMHTIEDLFPEFKESEDEKIRKEIIDFIYDKTDTYELREKSNSWLAWLEKQDEQKPQRMISAEAKEAMYDKPAWSEEDEDVINHLIDICKGAKKFIQFASCTQDDITKCQDWLTSLKERIE